MIVRFMVAPWKGFAVSDDGERRRATTRRLQELDPARARVGAIVELRRRGPGAGGAGGRCGARRRRWPGSAGARPAARRCRTAAAARGRPAPPAARACRRAAARSRRRARRAPARGRRWPAARRTARPAPTPVGRWRRISRVSTASDANSATMPATTSAGRRSSHACPAARGRPRTAPASSRARARPASRSRRARRRRSTGRAGGWPRFKILQVCDVLADMLRRCVVCCSRSPCCWF